LRDFLAAKPGRAAAFRRKAEGLGIEFGSTIPEIGPELGVVTEALVDPVRHYTTISSLLY
jgi:hypothetical protein